MSGQLRRWLVVPGLVVMAGFAPGLSAATPAGSGFVVDTLTVEHLANPLGIDAVAPRLAWLNHAQLRGSRQTAYQVRVGATGAELASRGSVWDSGKVGSAASYEVPYAGRGLASTTRYYWAVRTWDSRGQVSGWSAPAWFETAFFDSLTGFSGSWIGRTAATVNEVPEPLLRKEFTVAKPVRSARLYIAGLGYYKAYVNGKVVGDHELDPGFTNFANRAYYVTHDVTSLVRSGGNALGVRLGRGFFGDVGTAIASDNHQWRTAAWHSEPKLDAVLAVTYADGSVSRVVSDASWLTQDGPTTNELPGNETYDARLEKPGWTSPGYNATGWTPALVVAPPGLGCSVATGPAAVCASPALLQAQPNEPIKVTKAYDPVKVTKPAAGLRVYQFPVMTAGWARITFKGKAGTQVKIRYSEKLNPDGTAPLGELSPQEDTYTLRGGGPETYQPAYSYKGYLYVQVAATTLPQIVSIKGLEVTSAVPITGAFESSSRLLNAYDSGMRQTMHNNLHSIPTDTPTYEKAGWTGDSHLFGSSAIRSFGMAAFYEKYLQDINDAILPSGDIPSIVPSPQDLNFLLDPAWGAAGVFLHYELYQTYGDTAVLRRDYATLAKWMTAMDAQSPGGIYYGLVSYGDWSIPTNGGTQSAQIHGTAYVYRAATMMAEMATAIGESLDATRWSLLATRVKAAYNLRFYDSTKGAYFNSALDNPPTGLGVGFAAPNVFLQTSNIEALSWGLTTPGSLPVSTPVDPTTAAVVANLVADVKAKGNHLATGASGTKLILPALTDNGQAELAYKVATNPTYPGWGFWFAKGATTMWEDWTEAARSRDHAFLGTVDDWLYTRVAGIRPAAPAFRDVTFMPYPVGDLTYASARQLTPLGVVSTCWQKGPGGSFGLDVDVPPGSNATVAFPGTRPAAVSEIAGGSRVNAAAAHGVKLVGVKDQRVVYRVGSGHYRFVTGNPPVCRGTQSVATGGGE